MFPAALRLVLGLLLGAIAGSDGAAAGTTRGAPSRTSAAAKATEIRTRKIGPQEYVSLGDVAAHLGFKLGKYDRGRRVVLRGAGVSAEIEAETRDVTVNGMRVFLGDPTTVAAGEIHVSLTDYERCLTPMLKPGYGKTGAVPGTRVVVLDPGHGGKDHGTSTNEKVYALDVAKRTQRHLQSAGFRVVLTREDDRYLTLAERPAIAHANKADLFVSIHFNAIPRDRRTSGVEVYTFPPAEQRSTSAWGLRNNAEEDDAPVNRFDYWNVTLAHAVHRRFVGDLKTFDRGKKLMHLGVLRSLNCPGVLVECGFLTSEAEARKIATPAYREQLAATLARGIRDYAQVVETARTRWVASSARR